MQIKIRDLTKEQYNNCVRCNEFCGLYEGCEHCPFGEIECPSDFTSHKDCYSDKLLDQKIEVNLLTDFDRNYLKSKIKNINGIVKFIIKQKIDNVTYQIVIDYFDDGEELDLTLPSFDSNNFFCMTADLAYTPYDLGLISEKEQLINNLIVMTSENFKNIKDITPYVNYLQKSSILPVDISPTLEKSIIFKYKKNKIVVYVLFKALENIADIVVKNSNSSFSVNRANQQYETINGIVGLYLNEKIK